MLPCPYIKTGRHYLTRYLDVDSNETQRSNGRQNRANNTIITYHIICYKVATNIDGLIFEVKPKEFVAKYLNVSVTECEEEFEIRAPYKTGRTKQGAIVIKPKNQTDIFALPSANLKKLAQGVIWRDEHFESIVLKDIALPESCSQAYVGTAIFTSFELLQSI